MTLPSACIHCGDILGVDGRCDCGSRHYTTLAELREIDMRMQIDAIYYQMAQRETQGDPQ